MRHTEGEHCTLLGLIYNHWVEHHEGPALKVIKHRVQLLAEPALTTLLTDFEETATGWVHHEPEDIPGLFAALIAEHKTMTTVRPFNNAIVVATKGVDIKKGRDKVHYQGSD